MLWGSISAPSLKLIYLGSAGGGSREAEEADISQGDRDPRALISRPAGRCDLPRVVRGPPPLHTRGERRGTQQSRDNARDETMG